MAAYEEKVPVTEQAKERYPISEDIKHCLPFLGNYCEKQRETGEKIYST